MFSGKYSILTCSFSASLVSLKQQTTFPSAASWVIVLCQCFVNLSIAHTQFTNILMAQLSMYGLTEKPIPLECRWIWQPCLSKLSLCLRRERERERVHGRFITAPLTILILTEFLWIQNADQCRDTNEWYLGFNISFEVPGVSLREGWSNALSSHLQQGTHFSLPARHSSISHEPVFVLYFMIRLLSFIIPPFRFP